MRFIFPVFGFFFGFLSISCAQTIEELSIRKQKADSLYESKEYKNALVIYQILESSFQDKNEDLAVEAGVQVAECYRKQRDPDQAIRKLDSLLEQHSDFLSTKAQTRALILHKKGAAFYNLFNYKEAIRFFTEALEIREKDPQTDPADLINGNHVIGASHQYRGDYERAVSFLERSVELQGDPPADKRLLFNTYTELARAYSKKGDYPKALGYFQTIVNFRKTYYKEEPWLIASAYNDLAAHYTRMEEGPKAIEAGESALEIYYALDELYEEDYLKMAKVYHNLGIAHELNGNFEKAQSSYETSVSLNVKHGGPGTFPEADSYNNLGEMWKEKDKIKAAIFLKKAEDIFREEEEWHGLADCLVNSGELELLQGNPDEALLIFQEAIALYLPGVTLPKMDQLPDWNEVIIGDKLGLLEPIAGKAEAFFLRYQTSRNPNDLKKAMAHYRKADKLVDLIRQDYQFDLSKTLLSGQVRPVYEQAINCALDLFELNGKQEHLETAYRFSGKSKSLTLYEAVKAAQARQFAGIPDQELEKLRQLKLEISDLELSLNEEMSYPDGDPEYLESLQTERLKLIQAKQELENNFKVQYPNYFSFTLQNSLPDPELLIQSLKSDQRILEFFSGDQSMVIFILDQKGLQYRRKEQVGEFNRQLDSLLSAIVTYHLSAQADDELYAQTAGQLSRFSFAVYQWIFEDLPESELSNDLIIIPDGKLGYLPFELLLVEEPSDPVKFASHEFLLKRYQFSYHYSAGLWYESLNIPAARKTKILALAPEFDLSRDKLSPLPGNENEVKTIRKLWNGHLLTGREATKSAFLKFAGSYNVWHLATHAKASTDPEDPGYLAFAWSEAENEPGRIFLNELYALDLPCDLVVLSACETGIGEYRKGEGLISLSRGMTYAGAKSLVTSLWKIDDARTGRLMASFYTYLREGKSKPEALHLAKLDYLAAAKDIDAHPFYWSALIQTGNSDPLPQAGTVKLNWYYFLVPVFLLAIFWWRRRLDRP